MGRRFRRDGRVPQMGPTVMALGVHRRALLAVPLLLTAGLIACAAPDRADVAADMESRGTLHERGYPLLLTHAEFQETDEGWVWVTQFAHPVGSPASFGVATEELVFMYPLETLVSTERANREELEDLGDWRSFIIAFRGDSTVYELEPQLMWAYADGEMDWREVTDTRLISS